MKQRIKCVLAALVVAVSVSGCGHYLPHAGWIALIDGEAGMDNWYATGSNANWRAAEGAIVADKTAGKGASVLASKRTFRDFEL